jgi:hypothetical protein
MSASLLVMDLFVQHWAPDAYVHSIATKQYFLLAVD